MGMVATSLVNPLAFEKRIHKFTSGRTLMFTCLRGRNKGRVTGRHVAVRAPASQPSEPRRSVALVR